ncbi:MAG: 2-C-methyl-D-erythritol 4-phosphate cytidylyltransferase [Dysgonamonadaceae bacterium]|jgi:2-C-methyl-D-erythritol 4-phosphate cytidylyltransferase|nr:2-C-methyl-D-erythritol 4-phosphate cytidylyltransferase [Dysgonamonadaceae bacterium]
MNADEQTRFVIVVAGGKGLRMGGDMPKQFMPLGDRPVLLHTLDAFYRYDSEIRIILVLPDGQRVYWHNLCTDYGFTVPHRIVSGGETRFHSVKNGLALVENALAAEGTAGFGGALVGIHDGVRPLIDSKTIAAVYERADFENGAYPAIPVTDSLRKFSAPGKKSVAVDRSKYYLVQTPQVFRAELIIKAYRQEYRPEFTDDVSVVEASGLCNPVMVEGSRKNIKLTTPLDFVIAKAMM